MNTQTSQMTAEQRQQMWNDAERDESTLNTPLTALELKPDEAKPNGEPAAQLPVDTTGNEQQAGAKDNAFAGVPQEFLDTMAGLQATVAQLQSRMRGAEGHIGGLKSSIKASREAAQVSQAAGNEAPTEAQIQAAHAGGSKAMAALKDKYPEFAVDLEAVLAEEREALRSAEAPAKDNDKPAGYTDEDIAKAKRDAFIEARHEGWETLISTPEFVGWYQRQAQDVKALGLDPSPAAGVKLLDAYKAERAQRTTPQDRLRAFEGLSTAATARRGAFETNKGIDQMTRDEYWAHLEAQDKQKS